MKAVLISIQPQWVEKIAAGWKTLELRKTAPNLPRPFKCYIYQTRLKWVFNLLRRLGMDDLADTLTAGFGKVVGEFVCDHILGHCEMANADIAEQQSYVRRKKILEYSGGKQVFGWHISDLVIYDEPKPLTDFVVRECLWHNIRNNGCIDASGERCLDCRLKRPPQSWCYVEGE